MRLGLLSRIMLCNAELEGINGLVYSYRQRGWETNLMRWYGDNTFIFDIRSDLLALEKINYLAFDTSYFFMLRVIDEFF